MAKKYTKRWSEVIEQRIITAAASILAKCEEVSVHKALIRAQGMLGLKGDQMISESGLYPQSKGPMGQEIQRRAQIEAEAAFAAKVAEANKPEPEGISFNTIAMSEEDKRAWMAARWTFPDVLELDHLHIHLSNLSKAGAQKAYDMYRRRIEGATVQAAQDHAEMVASKEATEAEVKAITPAPTPAPVPIKKLKVLIYNFEGKCVEQVLQETKTHAWAEVKVANPAVPISRLPQADVVLYNEHLGAPAVTELKKKFPGEALKKAGRGKSGLLRELRNLAEAATK